MANRKVPPALQSPPTSAPTQTPPEEGSPETAWTVLFRPLFWFLLLPVGVMLLLKWLFEF